MREAPQLSGARSSKPGRSSAPNLSASTPSAAMTPRGRALARTVIMGSLSTHVRHWRRLDWLQPPKETPITLQQLTYFLAAAEHGSFSAAAEELHLAQPSLSEQIRRLEAELGVALFTRAGRGLTLTEAGRLLVPHAQRTLAAADEAAASVREVRDLTGGTVAFGTFAGAHHYLLGGLVQEFRAKHPNVRVRAVGQNSAEVADAVRDGRLEAGLIVLPIDDRGLDVRPAMREELLYVSADPQRLREPMTAERLAQAPLILF